MSQCSFHMIPSDGSGFEFAIVPYWLFFIKYRFTIIELLFFGLLVFLSGISLIQSGNRIEYTVIVCGQFLIFFAFLFRGQDLFHSINEILMIKLALLIFVVTYIDFFLLNSAPNRCFSITNGNTTSILK